jgi:CheY-like chemotaxis protein
MMPKPILLLDDEEKFASMLQELLETHGYEAEYCLNPLEALNRIRSESFNLVISDYKMPQMDGARFLEEARKVDPDLPVIMISGLMNMPELIKVANIGVTLALEKPFRTEDLLESVQRFVAPGVARPEQEAVVSVSTEAVLSYPQPARSLADASEENQQFLESLWKVFQERIHLFMRVSRGAELRLVGEELLGWLGVSEAEVLRIGLVDTQTDFTRGWILENLSRPGVFLVDMRSTTWNPESAGILCDWIRFLDEADGDLSRHRVLYALSSNSVLPHPLPGLPLSMQERFGEERPLLAALRDRLPDLVVYAQRLLMPPLWEQIGPSVRTMLLGYSWPGGFDELKAFSTRLRTRFESGDELDMESVVQILRERSMDPGSIDPESGLESFLQRRQREFINAHHSVSADPAATLKDLGVDAILEDAKSYLGEAPLIYPDLLS